MFAAKSVAAMNYKMEKIVDSDRSLQIEKQITLNSVVVTLDKKDGYVVNMNQIPTDIFETAPVPVNNELIVNYGCVIYPDYTKRTNTLRVFVGTCGGIWSNLAAAPSVLYETKSSEATFQSAKLGLLNKTNTAAAAHYMGHMDGCDQGMGAKFVTFKMDEINTKDFGKEWQKQSMHMMFGSVLEKFQSNKAPMEAVKSIISQVHAKFHDATKGAPKLIVVFKEDSEDDGFYGTGLSPYASMMDRNHGLIGVVHAAEFDLNNRSGLALTHAYHVVNGLPSNPCWDSRVTVSNMESVDGMTTEVERAITKTEYLATGVVHDLMAGVKRAREESAYGPAKADMETEIAKTRETRRSAV